MDKPIMDAKATLFEGILLEFNWGQHSQQFRSLDLSKFVPSADRILTEGALKDQIALYLRWGSHIAALDKANFASSNVLAIRNQCVHAILTRMQNEQPNHPALIVLGNDCQIAIQKAQGLVFSLAPPQSGSRETKTHIHSQFFKKIGLRTGYFPILTPPKMHIKTNTSASQKINRMPVRRNC